MTQDEKYNKLYSMLQKQEKNISQLGSRYEYMLKKEAANTTRLKYDAQPVSGKRVEICS